MRQMVFAYVPIKGWIVDPYIYCFFEGSDKVLVLPLHNSKVVKGGAITSDVTMVIYWEGALRCSLNLSPNVLDDSPIYSSSHSTLSHLYL